MLLAIWLPTLPLTQLNNPRETKMMAAQVRLHGCVVLQGTLLIREQA